MVGIFFRINLATKTDLVMREMEVIQDELAAVSKKAHVKKNCLKSQLEEMNIREEEIKASMELFEGVFISGTIDRYPQKNNSERFIR